MRITPELLLQAYANGYFPMADGREAKGLNWYYPESRGIIGLDDFHVPKSLAKFLKKSPFHYTVDRAFNDVIAACAERDSTWINDEIIALYCKLHEMGFAHSVEVWLTSPSPLEGEGGVGGDACSDAPARTTPHPNPPPQGGRELVGGLYGVSLGGAFFGESMFSRAPNASKAALVELVRLLKQSGYTLLDAQYVNEHLLQFGIQEIKREEYLERLEAALQVKTGSWVVGHGS